MQVAIAFYKLRSIISLLQPGSIIDPEDATSDRKVDIQTSLYLTKHSTVYASRTHNDVRSRLASD